MRFRINKRLVMLVLYILLGVMILSLYYFYDLTKPVQVCIKGQCFSVEVADTPEDLSQGMKFRGSLAKDKGMLFVFEQPGMHAFWMKNTFIPLDMVWISEDNRIVYMKKYALPCRDDPCERYFPDQRAKYVLEIRGGLSDEYGFIVGENVKIS